MKICKLLTKLSNEILPLVFWLLLLFGFDKVYIAVLTILSALIHEIGHYIAIISLKSDTGAPIGHISGFRIRQKSILSYNKTIAILLCGPLFNIALGIIVLPFINNRYLMYVCVINFATGLSNLLPIRDHDGYLILSEIFKSKGCSSGLRILLAVSFFFSAITCFFSLYLMYYRNEGYWIFGIFIATLLSEMSKNVKTAISENNGEKQRKKEIFKVFAQTR